MRAKYGSFRPAPLPFEVSDREGLVKAHNWVIRSVLARELEARAAGHLIRSLGELGRLFDRLDEMEPGEKGRLSAPSSFEEFLDENPEAKKVYIEFLKKKRDQIKR